MQNDEATKRKRKVRARIEALKSIGRSDEQIADAVLAFDDLSEPMRNQIKKAKAAGQSGTIVNNLLQGSQTNDSVVGDIEATGGALGKVAGFLGMEKVGRRLGYELNNILPGGPDLSGLSEEDQRKLKTGDVSNREALASGGMTLLNAASGGAGGAVARTLGASGKLVSPLTTGARALNPVQKAGRVIASPVRAAAQAGSNFAARAPIRTGMALGAAEGALSGAQEKEFSIEETLKRAGTGLAIGGAIGMLPFGRRLASGERRLEKDTRKMLENITPDLKDISQKEYEALLKAGRVTPRTATKPAQYVLSDRQIAAAHRHADAITPDPVKTSINISERISQLDNQVGEFLTQNNGIYNTNEVKSALRKKMSDITDVTVDPARLESAKNQLIDNFVDSLEQKDMYSLWKARKAFDQRIESAFSGSPSMQKEVKLALRNSVQDFISSKTPNSTYKQYMGDMSSLFDLQDLTVRSAAKERGYSAISNWVKDHPNLKWILGIAGATAAYGAVNSVMPRSLGGGAGASE